MQNLKHGWQGARVKDPYKGREAIIIQWEPLTAAMNDALIEYCDDKSQIWTSTHILIPIREDGSPDTLPRLTRKEAIQQAEEDTLHSLHQIQVQWRRSSNDGMSPIARKLMNTAIEMAIEDMTQKLKDRG